MDKGKQFLKYIEEGDIDNFSIMALEAYIEQLECSKDIEEVFDQLDEYPTEPYPSEEPRIHLAWEEEEILEIDTNDFIKSILKGTQNSNEMLEMFLKADKIVLCNEEGEYYLHEAIIDRFAILINMKLQEILHNTKHAMHPKIKNFEKLADTKKLNELIKQKQAIEDKIRKAKRSS